MLIENAVQPFLFHPTVMPVHLPCPANSMRIQSRDGSTPVHSTPRSQSTFPSRAAPGHSVASRTVLSPTGT